MASFIDRATLHPRGWNDHVRLPYGLRASEIKAAIDDIYDLLYNVNRFLVERGWDRLEETLSAATFSGVISELVVEGVSRRSATVIKNQFHNGRPDLVPREMYEDDACHRGSEGIEVKASRWSNGWQGHNIEDGWIMICQYFIDRETHPVEGRSPSRVDRVLCAQLSESDWSFSGRGEPPHSHGIDQAVGRPEARGERCVPRSDVRAATDAAAQDPGSDRRDRAGIAAAAIVTYAGSSSTPTPR